MKILRVTILILVFLWPSANAFGAPVFVNDYQPESEMNHVTGVVFNPTGTKMYVLGFHTSNKSYVSEVPLSVPFSTQSAGTPVLQEITSATKRAQDLKFNSDGSKLFILTTKAANDSDGIHVFSLSTPYDTSNLESDADAGNQTYIQFGSDPRGLDFNSDGTKMYVLQSSSQVLEQYNLSTPFDPSSRNNRKTISSLKGDRLHQGFGFSSDGYKMFIVKAQRVTGSVTNIIEDYNLTTPFEIDTATLNEIDNGIYTSVTNDSETDERIAGITFNFIQGANKLYYTDFHESDLVREFDLPCAYGIISCIDPTKNKDDVASAESQSEAAKKLIQHTTYPVLNRMEWLRRNNNRINLTNQNIKLQFSNEILNSLTEELIPLYFSKDSSSDLNQNSNWSFWSEGTISIGKIGDTSNSSSKDINTSAITFGADKRSEDNIMRGIALRFGSDDVDVGDLGSALDMNSFSLTFYESKPRGGDRFTDHLLGLSFINSDLLNNSGSISTDGERYGEQLYGSLSLRDTFSKNKFNFTPKIKINYGITHFGEYTETGAAGLNLKFDDQYIGNFTSSIGASLDNTYELKIGSLIPYFDFEYYADMSPSSQQKFSYESNGSAYTFKNINNATHNIIGGIGFDLISNNGLTLMTKYTRDQAKDSKNDNFVIALDYKNSQKSFYSMSFQDSLAKLSHNKELDNFQINLDSHYELFNKDPEYGLFIKLLSVN